MHATNVTPTAPRSVGSPARSEANDDLPETAEAPSYDLDRWADDGGNNADWTAEESLPVADRTIQGP
jgi:hypothetical protein